MKLTSAILIAVMVFTALAAGIYFAPSHGEMGPRGLDGIVEWQRMANPGELSQAHAFLNHNCKACHTPVSGVEASKCIVCHANDEDILNRQPTAFHADIGSCQDCHLEHRGRHATMSEMDHEALAKLGRDQLEKKSGTDSEAAAVLAWIRQVATDSENPAPSALVHPDLSSHERTLNCAACHQNDDRHLGLFGHDCSACHEATRWTLPEFLHPSTRSKDCAQCHQAPPSHYMMHFNMISKRVAGVEHADVSQCFLCHQTTSWNDIKGAGFYKHH